MRDLRLRKKWDVLLVYLFLNLVLKIPIFCFAMKKSSFADYLTDLSQALRIFQRGKKKRKNCANASFVLSEIPFL